MEDVDKSRKLTAVVANFDVEMNRRRTEVNERAPKVVKPA
jgi:hypothetical protein